MGTRPYFRLMFVGSTYKKYCITLHLWMCHLQGSLGFKLYLHNHKVKLHILVSNPKYSLFLSALSKESPDYTTIMTVLT